MKSNNKFFYDEAFSEEGTLNQIIESLLVYQQEIIADGLSGDDLVVKVYFDISDDASPSDYSAEKLKELQLFYDKICDDLEN